MSYNRNLILPLNCGMLHKLEHENRMFVNISDYSWVLTLLFGYIKARCWIIEGNETLIVNKVSLYDNLLMLDALVVKV